MQPLLHFPSVHFLLFFWLFTKDLRTIPKKKYRTKPPSGASLSFPFKFDTPNHPKSLMQSAVIFLFFSVIVVKGNIYQSKPIKDLLYAIANLYRKYISACCDFYISFPQNANSMFTLHRVAINTCYGKKSRSCLLVKFSIYCLNKSQKNMWYCIYPNYWNTLSTILVLKCEIVHSTTVSKILLYLWQTV